MTKETRSISQTLNGLEGRFSNLKILQKELAEKRERLFPSDSTVAEHCEQSEQQSPPSSSSLEEQAEPIVTSPELVMSEENPLALQSQTQSAAMSATEVVSSKSMSGSAMQSVSASSKSVSQSVKKSSSSSSTSSQVMMSQSSSSKSMQVAEMSSRSVTQSVQKSQSIVSGNHSAVVVGVLEKVTDDSAADNSITE